MRTVEVPVEALTHDSFRKLGLIIGEPDEPPAWQRPGSRRGALPRTANRTQPTNRRPELPRSLTTPSCIRRR